MVDSDEILDLAVGDSELILTQELKANSRNFYVRREIVEAKWPPTKAEREENTVARYSKAAIFELMEDEEILDRVLTKGVLNGIDCVVFKKR